MVKWTGLLPRCGLLAAISFAACSGRAAHGGTGAPDAGARVDAGQSGGSTARFPDEWHQLGYDERNHYHNPSETRLSPTNAAMLELKWTFKVSGFPPGSPVIAEGKVFVLATGGLYAIDLQGGTEAWNRTDLVGTASVAYYDHAIYVHTQSADLYKLGAADGMTLWGPIRTYGNEAADGISSPIVANGKVIVGNSAEAAEIDTGDKLKDARMQARGGVFAADVTTGEMAWHYDTTGSSENGAMVWSSVAVDVEAGAVYATTGNNWDVLGESSDAIHAIDIQSGARLWLKQVRTGDVWNIATSGLTGEDTDFGANPIVAEVSGKKIVAAGDKGSAFWALDATTGEIAFEHSDLSSSHAPANGGVLNNGAFDGRLFYVVSNDPSTSTAVLHALDPAAQGADAWPARTFGELTWGMPTLANGLLIVPINAQLYVLDASNGETLTMFDTGGTIAAGGAAIAQGKIVVASGLQYPFGGNVLFNDEVRCYGLP